MELSVPDDGTAVASGTPGAGDSEADGTFASRAGVSAETGDSADGVTEVSTVSGVPADGAAEASAASGLGEADASGGAVTEETVMITASDCSAAGTASAAGVSAAAGSVSTAV